MLEKLVDDQTVLPDAPDASDSIRGRTVDVSICPPTVVIRRGCRAVERARRKLDELVLWAARLKS